MSSTADKLKKISEQRKEVTDEQKRIRRKLESCANKIFSSDAGKFWAKHAFEALGVNRRNQESLLNPYLMAAEKGNYHFFLAFFKELLKPEVMAKIEQYKEKGGKDE